MRACLPLTLMCVAAVTTGCLFPAAMSTVGALGSDAPVAWSHWGDGQGSRYCMAAYEDVVDAALRAGEALDLTAREKTIGTDRAYIRFADQAQDRVDVTIERRSNTMTVIRFDVGWFGPTAFGRLVDQQIVAGLRDPASAAEFQPGSK